jgi:serine/threonine-protein kinase
VIAHGGSGVVVRALDRDILREVAIKIVDPNLTDDGSEVDRFAEEARITGQLEHPNIVPIYELGVDQRGRRFLCMKLIEGVTLDETLHQKGAARLDPAHLAELLQVFVKVCDAVSFAHSRGVLHRDLKPTNIMISDFGQVYVLDWGIARVRPSPPDQKGPRVRVSDGQGEPSEPDPPGALIGTACYMAPEQLHGHHDMLDERTDVFALGATLYQVLAGRPPLTPEIVRAIWMRRPAEPVTPPDRVVAGGSVPPELARIAMRALAHDPSDRHASVAELKRDVEAFQRGAWDLPRIGLPAGAIVIREGEPGDAAYVILEGRCVAYRTEGAAEVELRVMGPGEVFGETAVFSHKPRSASVKAATAVSLLVVTGDVLSKALGLNSWMGAFVQALADRFREADQRLRDLGRTTGVPEPPAPSFRLPSLGHDRKASLPELVGNVAAFEAATAGLPRVRVSANTVIIAEGQPGDAAYVVLSGRCVDCHLEGSAEVELRTLSVGEVLGETAALSGERATSTVKAVTDVELLVVAREELTSALRLNSWMGAFVRALAERLKEADRRLRALKRPNEK